MSKRLTRVNERLARSFIELCERQKIAPPRALVRGLEIIDVAERHARTVPHVDVLQLDADAVRARVDELTLRRVRIPHESVGLGSGADELIDEVSVAVWNACLPDLERITGELRPILDRAARPLVEAVQTFGFTASTTPDQVIDIDNPQAPQSWKKAQKSLDEIARVAAVAIEMNKTFSLPPDAEDMNLERQVRGTNYSVLFSATDRWSTDDDFLTPTLPHSLDWYALAVGGIRLNSPAEVAKKLAERSRSITDRKRISRVLSGQADYVPAPRHDRRPDGERLSWMDRRRARLSSRGERE